MLGLLVLGAFLLWRRRARPPEYLGVLPDGFAATVATSLYGLAAAVLALESLDALALLVAGGDGAGQWLSGAAVALAMAVLYGVSLYRTVLNRAWLGPATSKLGLAERSSS